MRLFCTIGISPYLKRAIIITGFVLFITVLLIYRYKFSHHFLTSDELNLENNVDNPHQEYNSTNTTENPFELHIFDDRIDRNERIPNQGYEIRKDVFEKYRNSCVHEHLCKLFDKPPIKFIEGTNCTVIEDCLTIVIKTRYRYLSLIRLLNSIWSFYPSIKVIAVDEPSNNETPEKIALANFTKENAHRLSYNYVPINSGISYGRNFGVNLSETEFVMISDDDFVFTEFSRLENLWRVFRTTNVAVVGSMVTNMLFHGVLIPNTNSNERLLYHYTKANYGFLPNHPECVWVDIGNNIFIIRKSDYFDIGGYNKELVVAEHKDFFARLVENKKNIVYCYDFSVVHRMAYDNTRKFRFYVWNKYYRKQLAALGVSKVISF